MNYIILSRTEDFLEGALLICKTTQSFKKECLIRFLEEMDKDGWPEPEAGKRNILYFLTNHPLVRIRTKEMTEKGFLVVNRRMIAGDTQKLYIQRKLAAAGVNVPNSMPIEKNFDLKFPLFIKSQDQAKGVVAVGSPDHIETALRNIGRTNDWYLEESVAAPDRELIKYYFLNGEVIGGPDSGIFLQKALNKIGKAMGLEVFSADIFVDREKRAYWCIDVNPAPALFGSQKARDTFAKEILA